MPFTRISLRTGRSPEDLVAIRHALYHALTGCFEVPENDSFVAIHQHAPEELVFDHDYGGGPRSDDYIYFQITTGKRRSEDVTAAFLERLVANLAEAPGIRPEDVMVQFINMTPADWSFANGRLMSRMTPEELGRTDL
ncbi:tautomerase family protein [Martelella alba]|uniref:Tautomerase family protein n=1 Tax=Martelella alba TaxID=2590451 RepID=A0A506TYS0_9HYPH|nr:tautomerase family protein [Martelella alba]TPW27222.1 tautomerase family protein [Martelella alba]